MRLRFRLWIGEGGGAECGDEVGDGCGGPGEEDVGGEAGENPAGSWEGVRRDFGGVRQRGEPRITQRMEGRELDSI